MFGLMSFNILNGMSVLDLILRDKDATAALLQKLDLIQTQDQIFMNDSLTVPLI
jgi:hypothetical protein